MCNTVQKIALSGCQELQLSRLMTKEKQTPESICQTIILTASRRQEKLSLKVFSVFSVICNVICNLGRDIVRSMW